MVLPAPSPYHHLPTFNNLNLVTVRLVTGWPS